MKKVLLFTAIGLWATQLSAQSVQEYLVSTSTIQNKELPDQKYLHSDIPLNSVQPELAGDTVWLEDFSNGIPTGWVLSGADASTCPWRYTFTGSNGFFNGSYPIASDPMNSASASNGFLLCDPDSTNQAVNGQPSGSNYVYLESYITTSAIDLTGEPSVRLEFEQSFRYNNSPDMEVSVSTDGVSWTTFEAKGAIAANTASPDPMTFSKDVSSLVGGSSTVYIKIGWSARVYFWMIDDIRFVVPPANDLVLDNAFYRTVRDTGVSQFYSRIPLSQAVVDTVQFSANVINTGSAIQPNTKLTNTFSTPTGSSTLTSNIVNIAPGQTDSLIIGTLFNFDQGVGDYSWTFAVASDSIDGNPADNFLDTVNIEVTDSIYSRDRGATGNFWYGAGSTYEIGPLFDIYDSVKATSITLAVGDATTAGEAISLYIYDGSLTSPIVSREFVTLTAADIGALVTFSIPETILPPGQYIVTYKTYSDQVNFLRSDFLGDPQTCFVDVSSSGTWGWTTSIPVIRLNVSDDLVICDLTASAVQTGNNAAIASGSAGTAPYSYLWSEGSVTNAISGVAPGTYTVTVTDDAACTASATVDIVTGVIEAGIAGDVAIYPNPNNGNYQLSLEGVYAGDYNLTVTNIIGQVVYQNVVNVNGNYNGNVALSNIQNGIYFMEIANNNGEKSVIRFIVK